ncbi:SLC13 family permease [Pseudochelatococcus contaminans]|uniref:Na+/H+ antiporter NhaD/arsenite permease-like protein n=1 Tax=Pseudochelatococcus contaminans TaxID=1538103 RepID=A0A7W6EH93_9HYPH|nr:SLC13 family permease [Pseudochelatococcus contaminans]MBB3809617.1 Na+/H+ antiporter NhaD/arsenite permease-like protein [Pseudochelatococcus contaminans]
MDIAIVIFLLVYVAMGFGKLPGFKVDRTGAAVIGALAMIVAGRISGKDAWESIDYRTIGMLFGLMVVSAAFVVSGFYDWTARRVATLPLAPPLLLAVLVVVGGLLSSLLTNDVVVVAMTPLLVSVTLARGLNPVPFLLAFCFAANTGSSGSLIGSPQNMIAAQGLGLSFNGFLQATALPALLSLPIVWGIVTLMYRGRWAAPKVADTAAPAAEHKPHKLKVHEVIKASVVTVAVIAAFVFSDWPRELIALAAAGLLLINRKISSTDMLAHVDGNLLMLIMGLFVVNAALAATGLPQMLLSELRSIGFDLSDPVALFFVGGALSNIVGNNPAVMLLVPFLEPGHNAYALGAALALGTGFSSNLIVFGSLAGIIVVEQAAAKKVQISFGEFARAGVPVTIACMLVAMVWIIFLGS